MNRGLEFDRPHPRVLRIAGPTFDNSLALESIAVFGPEWQQGRAAFQQKRAPNFVPESKP